MSVISKELFYKTTPINVSCDVLHFWNDNCFKAVLGDLPFVFIGSAKFFLPIYTVKALLNYKQLKDKKVLKELLLSEVRGGCYGVAMYSLVIWTICLLNKITGRLHYYNLGFLPGIVGGLSVLVETKENRVIDRIIFFNLLVEAFFRNLDYFKILKLTPKKETIIFMFLSCALMHNLANRKNNIDYFNFWFYIPPKVNYNELKKERNEEMKCSHKRYCLEFLTQGAVKYFGIGYLVNIIKLFIPNMQKLPKNPSKIFKILFDRSNVSFGIMLASYVAVFRGLTCILRNDNLGIPLKFHTAIAGFLSGLTYIISPNLQLLIIALTTLLQTTYSSIKNKLKIKHDSEVPAQLLFMLCSGILLHNEILCNRTCPPYYQNMINLGTNNRFREVYEKLMFLFF